MSETDNLIAKFLEDYYSKVECVEKAEITVHHNIYKEVTGIDIKVIINDKDVFEAIKMEEKLVHNQTMEESMKEIYETCHMNFNCIFVFK